MPETIEQVSINHLYAPEDLTLFRQVSDCSRRLQRTPALSISPNELVQPIDLHIGLRGDDQMPQKNMEGYPSRSLDNALGYIDTLAAHGINQIMLRLIGNASGERQQTIEARKYTLDRHQAVLAEIRQHFPVDVLTITADPFSLALNPDKTWGVKVDGRLSYFDTMMLFADVVTQYSAAGASYVLTLGRFEREVELSTRTIEYLKSPTRVASFSTNLETTNAYVYLEGEAGSVDTGQKILVGNFEEQMLRALEDIHDGTRLVIVKPSENYHILNELKHLLSHAGTLREFLQQDSVQSLLATNVHVSSVCQQIVADPQRFINRAQQVKLAGYTISGTYFQDVQIRRRRGDFFLWHVINERFLNIKGALCSFNRGVSIVDRNALWYATHRQCRDG